MELLGHRGHRDAAGVPRYLVLDARSSQVSMDPVDIITRASPVAHERRDSVIATRVGDGSNAFAATIDMPPGDAAPRVFCLRDPSDAHRPRDH